MTMRVLHSRQQVTEARREMVARKISGVDESVSGKAKRLLKRAGVNDLMVMGDHIKSWDVLETIRLIQERLGQNDPVLDIGCYCSEVLVSLHKLGYRNLTGVDLNPDVSKMPFNDAIRYTISDFMKTPFQDETFSAITSISVIEHGFDGPRLFAEISRILKTGGVFTASVDYWPDKIDTSSTRFFGMDWLIFSQEDVKALVDEAGKHGLRPVGELRFEGQERAVRHGGYEYTFAWLALEKRP